MIRHIRSESSSLSRPLSETNFIPRMSSLRSEDREFQTDMQNNLDVWCEPSRHNAQLRASIEPLSPPIQRRGQASRSSPSPRRRGDRRLKPTVLQHPESESEMEYYENCWLDPLHPLGGGSSLTTSGCPSDNSGAPACTLETSRPQNLVDPIDGQDWVKQPNNLKDSYQQPAVGGESIQSRRSKRWTHSKQCLAPARLQTMCQDSSDFSRLNAPFHDDSCVADCGHPTDDRYSIGGDRGEHSFCKSNASCSEQKEAAQSPGVASGGRGLSLPKTPEKGPVRRRKRTRYFIRLSYRRPRVLI